MSTCPRCGAENYINTCESCGFEQTRDVLSYYTLTRLNEDDVKFFDTEARLIRNCEKQLKALNSFIKENGTESSGTNSSLRELCEEYLSLTVPKPKNEYEGKSADELYQLGQEYYSGKETGEPNYEKAFELFSMAAEKDSGDAMFYLGRMYDYGQGTMQDYAQAFEWYTKAAEKGNAAAMNNLGYMYDNGKGVTRDSARAIEWFKKAAEKGNAFAMLNLGLLYYNGVGVTEDYAQAFEWYKKAAEKGEMMAMFFLGEMYKNGDGVARDKQKAKEWKRKAKAALREIGK